MRVSHYKDPGELEVKIVENTLINIGLVRLSLCEWPKEVIFHIFKLEKQRCAYEEKIRLILKRNHLNIMKLPSFMFVGSSINKNRVVMVWKGYYNAIHFSIIISFYITMHPVFY